MPIVQTPADVLNFPSAVQADAKATVTKVEHDAEEAKRLADELEKRADRAEVVATEAAKRAEFAQSQLRLTMPRG